MSLSPTISAADAARDRVVNASQQDCVERLRDAHTTLVAAEIDQLILITQLADLHGPAIDASARVMPADGRSVRVGHERPIVMADGTPRVGEFLAIEVGAALGIPDTTARFRIRDAVELQHRHPRLWSAVIAGHLRYWIAQKVAAATRYAELGREAAAFVDARFADLVARGELPVGRMLALVDGLVLKADPEAYEARRLARLTERYARIGMNTGHGLRTFYAQADAADVIFVDAMIARLAELVVLDDPACAQQSLDERRATAFGMLGRPADVVRLLRLSQHAATPDTPHDAPAEPESFCAGEADDEWAADDPAADGRLDRRAACDQPGNGWAADDQPEDEWPEHDEREDDLASQTLAAVAAVSALPAASLCAPRAVLHVHLSADMLTTRTGADGIARIDGIGPATLAQLHEHLANCRITVVPVVNIAGPDAPVCYPVDAYEIPDAMRRLVQLRHPFEMAPYRARATRSSRVDLDHTEEYRRARDGTPSVPGQTRPDNLGPLSRMPHRAKTHTALQVRQIAPGVFLWTTRLGQVLLVDADGTHDLGMAGHSLARAEPPDLPEPSWDTWDVDAEFAAILDGDDPLTVSPPAYGVG